MSQFNNVFLIDDDGVFNFITARTIKNLTFAEKVTTFDNAQTAFQELQQLSRYKPEEFPDMIFLDLNMPKMNGWEFLNEYEKISDSLVKKCKIVILTSSIDGADIKYSKSYKAVTDFVSKPLTVERLQGITDEPQSTTNDNKIT